MAQNQITNFQTSFDQSKKASRCGDQYIGLNKTDSTDWRRGLSMPPHIWEKLKKDKDMIELARMLSGNKETEFIENTITMEQCDEHIVFFYGSEHFLSQWYPCMFVLEDRTFTCCEQRMMYKKAMIFGDIATAERIMKARAPRTQKFLGRQVKNFEQKVWERVREDVIYEANHAKFSQNVHLKRMLIDTGSSILAEASPYDEIYGIGLSVLDPRAKNVCLWAGQNLLGKVLMFVRASLN